MRSPSSLGTVTGTGPAARSGAVSAPPPDDRRDPWLRTVHDGANTVPPARQELHRHVEISDDEHTVAAAEVTSQGPGGTAWASLRAESGHITPGRRASLVDAVLDLPQVRESARLEAAFPLGDGESLQRLQQRCQHVTTHQAGFSALLDASLPPGGPGARGRS